MAAIEQSVTLQGIMSKSSSSAAMQTYDLVSVGFGATQLATAIAIAEAAKPINVLFLERKPEFSWHPESQTARARMEIPFMYDLATLRNPRTSFSYVNYLLEKNRLVEFANSDRLNPLREEFNDYMKWCAEQFKDQVRYSSEVLGVTLDAQEGQAKIWKVAVRDSQGKTNVVYARNIVVPSPSKDKTAAMQPLTSVEVLSGQQTIPLSNYIARRNELRGTNEPRLNVSLVSSGLQTAEVLNDLLSCPRLGNITLVTEDETMMPLTVLNEQEPPQPQLCSIWAKPGSQNTAVTSASELIQTIYMRGYEKQVQTRGEFRLRVILGQDSAAACSKSDIVIRDDTTVLSMSTKGLLQSLDPLVIGCQQKSESLVEVLFKRSAVADNCRLWLVSAQSEGGRTLAKDVALAAGEIVRNASSVARVQDKESPLQARI